MDDIHELIAKYTENETSPTIDDLYEKLWQNGTNEEKDLITDTYISYFGENHYDYMCGKLNNINWIWEMMDWLEKIQTLQPDFEYYHFYKAHVYEMLSSVTEIQEDKLKFNILCIEHFQKQLTISREDVSLLIDLSENIFNSCELTENYSPEKLKEVKEFLIEALHLERKTEHQSSFFGFNGSAIYAFLQRSYSLLQLPTRENIQLFEQFITSFKKEIKQYVLQDPSIYYHWADTLKSISNSPCHSNKSLHLKIVYGIWQEIKELLSHIENIHSENEQFLTHLGHLFSTTGHREESYHYFEIASRYYKKALKINDQTWYLPHYVSDMFQEMAIIQLKNKETQKAKELFEQGFTIFEKAQTKVTDFQLSIYHAEYLYQYAHYFENFTNTHTLLNAKKYFEEALILGKNFYTSPFYGLAKIALHLDEKEECLTILKKCGEVFSNEYHTHDFKEIIDEKVFEEIRTELQKIITELENSKPKSK